MPSRSTKPSLTSLVAFFLIATLLLYVIVYFALVGIEHSPTTGEAYADYPDFAEPLSTVFRPLESIDRRIRSDLWAPKQVHFDFGA